MPHVLPALLLQEWRPGTDRPDISYPPWRTSVPEQTVCPLCGAVALSYRKLVVKSAVPHTSVDGWYTADRAGTPLSRPVCSSCADKRSGDIVWLVDDITFGAFLREYRDHVSRHRCESETCAIRKDWWSQTVAWMGKPWAEDVNVLLAEADAHAALVNEKNDLEPLVRALTEEFVAYAKDADDGDFRDPNCIAPWFREAMKRFVERSRSLNPGRHEEDDV